MYCYGDLVPRTIKDQGDILDGGGADGGGMQTDLLAAQIAVTSLGIIASIDSVWMILGIND